MMTMPVAAILLLMFQPEEVRLDLYADPDGEAVTVDLGTLPVLISKPLAKASEFAVTHAGRDVPREDPDANVVTIRGVVGREEKPDEIVIVHKKAGLRVVLTVRPAKERRIEAGRASFGDEGSVWISVCRWGEGEWKTKCHAEDLSVFAGKDLQSVDGRSLADLEPLAKGGRSACYLAPASRFREWRAVAERCYRAVLDKSYDEFVRCFDKRDRAQADRYANCRTYWTAVRKTVESNKVVEFKFVEVNRYGDTPKRKKLMFRRLDGEGKQVGYDTAIIVITEDGRWVVDSVSP